jgi:transcriptional activator for dhaKLM operon
LYADSALGLDFMGSAATENEKGRLSRLELANGGTLFLEKIEYLAPELQSALLQVIKQGVLTRLEAGVWCRWISKSLRHHGRFGESGGAKPL